MINFYKIICFNTMTMSTLISISSTSWLTAWIGLEINLLSIIPLMKSMKQSSSEAMIKYFIVQAMASSLLLFSIIIISNSSNLKLDLNMSMYLVLSMALTIKLGAAPFHFWFPEVMSGLNWEMNFIMMTWQKIAPMILLMYSVKYPMFMSIIIISSSMISGIQGLNQTCLRKIMAYSSINHMSWLISAILNSVNIWFYYFITYCIMNLNILIMLLKHNIFNLSQLSKFFSFNKNMKFFFMMNFLSLGGLPPFLGFLPKWLTINLMIKKNFIFMIFMLILFTMLVLYFYIRITFSSFSIKSNESLISIFNKMSFLIMSSNFITLMSLTIYSVLSQLF